jgi:hypothetical protein
MSQFSRFGLRGRRRVEVVKGILLPFELRELGDLPRSRVPKTLLNSKVLLNCGNVAMKSCARRHDYKADDRTPSTASLIKPYLEYAIRKQYTMINGEAILSTTS